MHPRNREPVAHFITFRCYGTWLHGDERGSVSRVGPRMHGEPLNAPDSVRVDIESAALRARPMSMETPAMRATVLTAMREVCVHRDWVLDAANVRTNHVHAVVGAGSGDVSPERIMNDLKAYATRSLRRAGLVPLGAPVWSRHGSTKRVWTPDDLTAVRAYVLDVQGEDLGAVYDRERDPR